MLDYYSNSSWLCQCCCRGKLVKIYGGSCMAESLNVGSNNGEIKIESNLWSLVVRKSKPNCVELFGETTEAREQRHQGLLDNPEVEFLCEFGNEENSFINKLRQGDGYEILRRIISITHHETACYHAARAAGHSNQWLI